MMAGVDSIICIIVVVAGLCSMFKPGMFVPLLMTYPILKYAPYVSYGGNEFKVLQLGSMNIFLIDYLIIIGGFLLARLSIREFNSNKNNAVRIFKSPISKLVLFMLAWNLLFCIMSFWKGFSYQNALRIWSTELIMLTAILIPLLKFSKEKMISIFKYTVSCGLLLVVFSLLRYFVTGEIETTSSGTARTLLGNAVVVLILPMCYLLFYSTYMREHRLKLFFLVAFFGVGILFAGHRSGWVVFFFVIAMYSICELKRNFLTLFVPLLLVSFLIISVIFVNTYNFKLGESLFLDAMIRIADTFDLENKTTQERFDKWRIAILVLKDNPVVGLGRFPVHTDSVDEEHNDNLLSFDELNKSTHNFFFENLMHQGVVGSLVLLFFMFIVLREIKKVSCLDYQFGVFIGVYVISYFIFSAFNTAFAGGSGKIVLFSILGFLNSELVERGEGPVRL